MGKGGILWAEEKKRRRGEPTEGSLGWKGSRCKVHKVDRYMLEGGREMVLEGTTKRSTHAPYLLPTWMHNSWMSMRSLHSTCADVRKTLVRIHT